MWTTIGIVGGLVLLGIFLGIGALYYVSRGDG